MIDQGLVASLIVVAVGVWVLARLMPPTRTDSGEVLDLLSVPVMAGVFGARVTAAALDDPSAFSRPGDLLLVRGGMELWAGIVTGVAALGVILHRRGDDSVGSSVADLSPYLLWGMAFYEGTCLVRDGCFGPVSALGLTPRGGLSPQFPVGLLAAACLLGVGVVVRRVAPWDPPLALLFAVGGLGAVRAGASVWLPRISEGLTRQHVESLAAVAVALVGTTVRLTQRARSATTRTRLDATRYSRSKNSRMEGSAQPGSEENPRCS